MTLAHLNSDQRQYFWMSIFLAGVFVYVGLKADGLYRVFAFLVVILEAGCALAIHRRWRNAPWLYLLGCCCLMGWATMRFVTGGYSITTVGMLVGGALSATGFYWLRKAMVEREPETDADADVSTDLFELPKEHESHVDALIEAYSGKFGEPQWVHHIVPKSLWLHRYADYVITIPPTKDRPTWLYGTLLLSALSGSLVELIIERPQEDTIGAIGTLSRLTEYFLDYAPLEEWNTMGSQPFFGDESAVRGVLFCRPPDSLPDSIQLLSGRIILRYVAGITEDQLATAQATDDEQGDFAGTKALHAKLRIAESGIANLPK